MARAGTQIENPVMGARLVFRETAEQTGGEWMTFEFFLEPNNVIAEAHLHPVQTETVEVLSGTITGLVDGRPETMTAGDVSTMQPGIPHIWGNETPEEARLLVTFRPALRTEQFLETVFGLACDGKISRKGVPRPLQLAVLLDEYRDEFAPASLPKPMKRIITGLVAPLGRRLGYRSEYPEYSGERRGESSAVRAAVAERRARAASRSSSRWSLP